MKKSIIAMLCSLLVVAGCNKKDDQNYKADYPIYSPVKVYGTLTLTEASSLPPGADYMIIPYLDTLRIYQDGAWRNFWPVVTDDDTPTGTTVGNSLLTLTNPSAISFLRVNADNSVTALSATNFKTALSFTATDVGLGNVTNESKATMFTSPTFTGVPIVPNPALGTYNQQIASTAFVYDKVVSILDTMDFGAGTIKGSIDSGLVAIGAGVDSITGGYLNQTVQITCTYESSSTTPDSTGYILSIGSNLAGYNLVDMEAFYSNSQGTAVPTIHAWRDRSGTRVAMTSTGANFTTDATIDTSNDDVAKGDRVQIRWTLGSGTPPDGFSVQLTFQKP